MRASSFVDLDGKLVDLLQLLGQIGVTRHLLADKLRAEKHADGRPIYSIATCLSLLVFYVFAMQCLSTVAVVRSYSRNTGRISAESEHGMPGSSRSARRFTRCSCSALA